MTPHDLAPIPLSSAFDVLSYGSKATQLGAAIRAGLPVPGGFGLGAAMVEAVVENDATAITNLRNICTQMPGSLAVRSSVIGEDSADASFAGQHATLLNVNGPDAVIAAVKTVWQSARSDSAMAYRSRVRADMVVRVGVVVQTLVAADVAGVLFTCNPITGVDELVIEAAWGLGEAIVQGLVIPDHYRVGRTGQILEKKTGFKEIAIRRAANGATREVSVPAELIERPCLDASHLASLFDLVVRCDSVFGIGPHDIEWAIEGQTVHLLQLRPITNVSGA